MWYEKELRSTRPLLVPRHSFQQLPRWMYRTISGLTHLSSTEIQHLNAWEWKSAYMFMSVYECMCVCACVCACVSVSVCACASVCVSECVCVIQMETEGDWSWKEKNGSDSRKVDNPSQYWTWLADGDSWEAPVFPDPCDNKAREPPWQTALHSLDPFYQEGLSSSWHFGREWLPSTIEKTAWPSVSWAWQCWWNAILPLHRCQARCRASE